MHVCRAGLVALAIHSRSVTCWLHMHQMMIHLRGNSNVFFSSLLYTCEIIALHCVAYKQMRFLVLGEMSRSKLVDEV